MNTKTIWAIVALVVLAGVGYYLYTVSGDKGSNLPGATEQTSTGGTAEVSDSPVVGVWQSNDDPKFTREFKADNTIVDRYEGDAQATQTGTWLEADPVKEGEESIGVSLDVLGGKTLLKITFEENMPMYFGVNSVTESYLELTNYSNRGNILAFTKVE